MREIRGDWRDLFLTFRMALDLRKLSLCLVGMALSVAGIALILAVALFCWQKVTHQPSIVDEIRTGRLDRAQYQLGRFSESLFQRSGAAVHACRPTCSPGPVRIQVRASCPRSHC